MSCHFSFLLSYFAYQLLDVCCCLLFRVFLLYVVVVYCMLLMYIACCYYVRYVDEKELTLPYCTVLY